MARPVSLDLRDRHPRVEQEGDVRLVAQSKVLLERAAEVAERLVENGVLLSRGATERAVREALQQSREAREGGLIPLQLVQRGALHEQRAIERLWRHGAIRPYQGARI